MWSTGYCRFSVCSSPVWVLLCLATHLSYSGKESVGKVRLDRDQVCESQRGLDRWFPLSRICKADEVQGEVLVEVCIVTGRDKVGLTCVGPRLCKGVGCVWLDTVGILFHMKGDSSLL